MIERFRSKACLGHLATLLVLATTVPAAAMNDPVTGRWLTRDPIEYDAGTANLYEDVFSQPTFWLDPFGLDAWKAECEWTPEMIDKVKKCIAKKL